MSSPDALGDGSQRPGDAAQPADGIPVRVLAIAGGSCSGKTTLSRRLQQRLGDQTATLVRLDWYYRDWGGGDASHHDLPNFDHPDALDFALFHQHVAALRQGDPVNAPVYDFATHTRQTGSVPIAPRPVVIIEGILALHPPQLRALFDLSCYIDCHEELRLQRRIARDVEERGRTRDSVQRQFAQTVRPMHAQFVEPARAHADLVIAQNDYRHRLDHVIDTILHRLGAPRSSVC